MAFYFALLNVSSKREDKTSRHRNRRRHSIASVESPLLDYRLLPRPQVMGLEEAASEQEGKRGRRGEEARGMRKSESSYSTGRRRREEEEEVHRKGHEKKKNQRPTHQSRFEDGRSSAGPSSTMSDTRKRKEESHSRGKDKKALRTATPRTKKGMASPNWTAPPNSPAILKILSPSSENGSGNERDQRIPRGSIRPNVQRRRQSPPESTTSGSRRSSKGSQNSLHPRETPSSSSCSRRESEEPAQGAVSSLFQASQKFAGMHLSKPVDKLLANKKVTFNGSPLVIQNNFLGDKAVLVRRASGTATVLRRCSTLAQPLAGCGVDWWGICATNEEGTGENNANKAIEQGTRRSALRPSLLRRRSTSDRGRVAFAFQNQGFLTEGEERQHRRKPVVSGGLKRAGTTKG